MKLISILNKHGNRNMNDKYIDTKWSRKNLTHNYVQSGQVCLIASISFLLEYAQNEGKYKAKTNPYNILSLCSRFLKGKHISKEIKSYTEKDIYINKQEIENNIFNDYHTCCRKDGNISGYKYLSDFLVYLQRIDFPNAKNIKLIVRKPDDDEDRTLTRSEAYEVIESFLSKNTGDNNIGYAALVLFQVEQNNFHSVFLGFDGTYFFRDSKYNSVTSTPQKVSVLQVIFRLMNI